jgi:hypothetical protein
MIPGTRVALRAVVTALLLGCCVNQDTHPLSAQGAGPDVAFGFSEGTGMTAGDLSGNGNAGTLVNGTGWTSGGRFGSGLLLDGINDACRYRGARRWT